MEAKFQLIPSCLLCNHLNIIAAHTGLWPATLDSHKMMSLLDRLANGFQIEWTHRSQVDDLTLDTLTGQFLGGIHCKLNWTRMGNNGDMFAGTLDFGLADLHHEILV